VLVVHVIESIIEVLETCLDHSIKNHDNREDKDHDDDNNFSRINECDISHYYLSQYKIPISSFEGIRNTIKIMHQSIVTSSEQHNHDDNKVKYNIEHVSPLIAQLKLILS